MIHIPSAGCGWAISGGTYTCGGLPKLDIALAGTTITGWIPYADVGDETVIDQFDHVPQHIEGFRMTLSSIVDMSGGTVKRPEVPELACRVDFDPFNELVVGTTPSYVYNIDNPELTGNTNTQFTGFLDFYNQVPQYKANFYVTVDGGTAQKMPSTETFPVYGATSYMGPGILEPMLNTQFGNIDIDMPPTPDLTTDAIIYGLVGLQGWRHAIDTRINNTYIGSSETGMVNLENAKNLNGGCANFTIHANASTVIGAPGLAGPSYTIDGGTIKVDGELLPDVPEAVAGSTIFDAYLDIYKYAEDETETPALGATITTIGIGLPQSTAPSTGVFQHLKFEYIGSVRYINSGDTPISGSTVWSLYEIHQGDCLYEVTLGGGTGGGGSTCDCKYNGPFMVTPGNSFRSVKIDGIDPKDELTNYAGRVFYNGADQAIQVDGYELTSIEPGSDIYANVYGNTINYSFAMEAGTPPAYNIRLAKVMNYTATYTIILGATNGHIDEMEGEIIQDLGDALSGCTVYPITDDYYSQRIIPLSEASRIYEVVANTCTGNYQNEGEATASISNYEPEIIQIHYGDIYVDGRWQ